LVGWGKDSVELAHDIAAAARVAGPADTIRLLVNINWRMQRVGALFALMQDDPEVGRAVNATLIASRGHLTFPELCTASLLVARDASAASLREYQVLLHEKQWVEIACSRFASTALEWLGEKPLIDPPDESSRAWFHRTMAFAELIQAG
jgi:hypothetical protein